MNVTEVKNKIDKFTDEFIDKGNVRKDLDKELHVSWCSLKWKFYSSSFTSENIYTFPL